MFYNAKNSRLIIGDTDMDYIAFGKGDKDLVMIPGLGDGLTTVKGLAVPFAIMYQKFAKNYKVHVFSRKNKLEEGYTTRDMARDQMEAMQMLGIEKADIIGISQGGMIAQHFAIDYPEMVDKLVLAVTSSRVNQTMKDVVAYWLELAEKEDYQTLINDTAEKMYIKYDGDRAGWILPVLEKLEAPDSYERFIIMAKACLVHDTYDQLDQIKAPTLVVGGEKDIVLEGKSSVDIADRIRDCYLAMYEDYGHGVYEEARDFPDLVWNFLHS